jgi:4-amino-4-deoxy-L-arabinose transferase-like glycosyltransferase
MVLAFAAVGFQLGGHALIDPDEGESAAVAAELARSGDFLVPHLNGLPRLDKPILFYAAEALTMRWLGESELAARLPALVFAWATAGLTAWFSARRFGGGTAWIAGTAAITSPVTMAMARTARPDSMVSFFMVLALVAFFQAVEGRAHAGRARASGWTVLGWAAMGAGVLTKGPVALAVPLLVCVPYALWRRRSLAVWHPAGWAALLLLVLPWAFAVEGRANGFLRYALVTETWQRLTTDELHRAGPIWYFLPYLLAGCLPWIVAVAASARRRERRRWEGDPRLVFLLLWLLLPLAFFSLAQSKRPQYILPLVPAVALLAARSWSENAVPLHSVRAGAAAWFVGCAVLFAAAVSLPGRLPQGLAQVGARTAWALGAACLAGGALAWAWARRGSSGAMALSLPLILLPALGDPFMRAMAAERSGKAMAAALQPLLGGETRVVGVEAFSPSLRFYLGQPIRVSTATGKPLGSNYVVRNFATLVTAGSPGLCRADCWLEELRRCARPTVFLFEAGTPGAALLNAQGLPILFADHRLVAVGPCRAGLQR